MTNGTQTAAGTVGIMNMGAQTIALAALLSGSVGTGGVASSSALQQLYRSATGATALVCGGADQTIQTLKISEQLTLVQSFFGLGITQLAGVLRVQRPTIYSWLSDSPDALRGSNAKRLDLLFKLASQMHLRLGQSIADVGAVRFASGTSLLDALMAPAIDPDFVLESVVADRTIGLARSESALARLRREKQFRETPQEIQEANLEGFIGA